MKTSLILFLTFLIFSFSFAYAALRYVPSEYATIQSALSVCVSGDSVIVAPGIYMENLVWPQIDGITLKSSSNRLDTIIDGNTAGRCLGFIGSWTNPVITQATTIDGFTFRKGYSQENGAGIMCYYSSPSIKNCIVAYNEAHSMGSGGGLYCYASSPMINNVIFVNNIAYSGGGAHIDPLSSPIFNHCVFADNTLNSPGGSFAAGIYGRYEVYFQLNYCTVSRNNYNNRAAIQLGEICTPIIQHTNITNNDYGVLVVHDGGLNMSNSNILNNTYAGLWHFDTDSDIISATNNWWGAASGPFHETGNPLGEGEVIIGSVNYNNWLSDFDVTTPPSPPVSISLDSYEDGIVTVNWAISSEPDIDHYEVNYGTNPLDVIFPNTTQVEGWALSMPCSQPTYFQVAAVKANNEKSWYSPRMLWNSDAIEDPITPVPIEFSVYPNPFNNMVSLKYFLKNSTQHSFAVYNIKGELIKSIYSGYQAKGEQILTWDGRDNHNNSVSNGIYLVQSKQGNVINTQKVIKVK